MEYADLYYYNKFVDCDNCGHSIELKIPKGKRWVNYLSDSINKVICEKCGCNIAIGCTNE